MKKLFHPGIFFTVFCAALSLHSKAQFSISAQFRPRAEFRDGQGAPLPKGTDPAFFISQRTRLSAGFSGYRFKVGITLQDARVWGQDVSTINKTTTQDNNAIQLYEAWAEVLLSDTSNKKQSFSIKAGRQELVYDDSRLLGNLDWLQQGRKHDAFVLKYESTDWKLHGGAAFNQNKENNAGTLYNPTPAGNYTGNTNGGSMYKALEYIYAGRKLKAGNISLLALADQFTQYHMDNNIKTWDTGTWSRYTMGIFFTNNFKTAKVTASAYYQTGKNQSGQDLNAWLLSANALFHITKKLDIGPGIDYTTGGTSGSTSNAFDPLYGTPHKFWGTMDYYYAGSGFGNRGLQDYYLSVRYKASDKLLLAADGHKFFSTSDIPASGNTTYDRNFGTEADFSATYLVTKMISFEAGYSHYWSTAALTSPGVKNITNAKTNNNWAYLMLNIKPEYIFR